MRFLINCVIKVLSNIILKRLKGQPGNIVDLGYLQLDKKLDKSYNSIRVATPKQFQLDQSYNSYRVTSSRSFYIVATHPKNIVALTGHYFNT